MENVEDTKTEIEESPLIQRYIGLVDFLSKVLDGDYELVLISFRTNKTDGAIVGIRNGFISGRKLGDSMLAEGKEALSADAFRYLNNVINYTAYTSNGNHLACSALFLGDRNKAPEGLLSINRVVRSDYDYGLSPQTVSPFMSTAFAASKNLLQDAEPREFAQSQKNIWNQLNQAFLQISDGRIADPSRLSVSERMSVINMLKKRGVFEMRNAVNIAADFFKLSEPTIYRYLQKVV